MFEKSVIRGVDLIWSPVLRFEGNVASGSVEYRFQKCISVFNTGKPSVKLQAKLSWFILLQLEGNSKNVEWDVKLSAGEVFCFAFGAVGLITWNVE